MYSLHHENVSSITCLIGQCTLYMYSSTRPAYICKKKNILNKFFVLLQSHQNYEDFDVFSLDDVDAAFDKIIQLKYSQNVSLKGK